jgi:hypothetical protein
VGRGGGGRSQSRRNTESTVRGMRGSMSCQSCQNEEPAADRERARAGGTWSDPGDEEPGARGGLGTRFFP